MADKHEINFFKGSPNPKLVPTKLLKHAASVALSDPTISGPGCDYGPDEGYLPLRQNIAQWLTNAYQPSHSIDAERICITGGASQNLACLLQVFTDPLQTTAIWLPQPTYHLVFQVFEDAGFQGLLKAVPEDAQGMDAKALDEAISRMETDPATLDRLCEVCMHCHIVVIPNMLTSLDAHKAILAVSKNLQTYCILCSDICQSHGHHHAGLPTRRTHSSCS